MISCARRTQMFEAIAEIGTERDPALIIAANAQTENIFHAVKPGRFVPRSIARRATRRAQKFRDLPRDVSVPIVRPDPQKSRCARPRLHLRESIELEFLTHRLALSAEFRAIVFAVPLGASFFIR